LQIRDRPLPERDHRANFIAIQPGNRGQSSNSADDGQRRVDRGAWWRLERLATPIAGTTGHQSAISPKTDVLQLSRHQPAALKVATHPSTWGIIGLYCCGWQTVGSAPDDKSFHSVANRRDRCTMVPFSRSKKRDSDQKRRFR